MKKISGDLSCQKQNKTQLFKGGANLLRSFIYLTHFTHTHTQHHHHQFRKLQLQNFLFDQVTRKWTVPDNQVVVQLLSCVWLFATPWTRPPCPSLSPRVCLNLCPLSQWCNPTISFSVSPLFCLQFVPASESFPMSWLFVSGGQSIRVLASASVLLMIIQGWFPLGLTDLISLQSKGLSRVFSNTVWMHKAGSFNTTKNAFSHFWL